jgi:DNA (cytosine-5)-methyltransferase 1
MRYFSLFSGIGGFELGINKAYVEITNRNAVRKGKGSKKKNEKERQRLESKKGKGIDSKDGQPVELSDWSLDPRAPHCMGYSEIDKHAIGIYEKYFKHTNYGDIRKIKSRNLPDFDLLIGGFPCQSFSVAGKRKGFEDTRGTLFFEIARIVAAKRPRLLLLENVKGLLSHEKGRTFGIILRTLDGLGYDLQWQVLNSKNFGVPQNRERVFIVGHLRGTPRPEVFPLAQNSSEDIVLPTITTRVTADSNGTYVSKRSPHQIIGGSQGNRVYSIKGISTTIASQAGGLGAKTGLYAVKGLQKIRRLTPKECERLQGFPDDWTLGASDTQRYKCLGNAVTVNVVQAIIEKLVFARIKRK